VRIAHPVRAARAAGARFARVIARAQTSCLRISKPVQSKTEKATGGRVISEDLGVPLAKVTLSDLGRAARVVVTKDDTTIIGGAGDKAAIAAGVERIQSW
jgi:chaperonin GroEL (HSP60 family)